MLDNVLDEMRPVICIAGPTASGKSRFAVDLAQRIDGEIVNADALQVYADLQILSARPLLSDMGGVPHHLFGHVPADTAYSTGEWLRDAVPVILDIMGRNRTPILVGGTGLYFKALLQGLADVPAISDPVRQAVRSLNLEAVQMEATAVDPLATARILGEDPQRLGRIVEVFRETGRPLSSWRAQTRPVIPSRHASPAIILPDRETLYDRINARFDAMLSSGALDEATSVQAKQIDRSAPMLKAIGLSHLLRYLDGALSLEEAIALAKRDSRRLAKRQMTWFRNQTPDWTVLRTEQDQARFSDSFA